MNDTRFDVIFDQDARTKILRGVNIIADAVGTTLGPRGRNVGIEKVAPNGETYARVILHDGVSVARSIELPDHQENFGAQIIKQAAQKQVDEVGDGTTVTVVLAREIIKECFQLIAAGINPMSLRSGLEDASERLVSQLQSLAIPVKDAKDTEFVATISAGNAELGKLVSDTFQKVGVEGVVSVEDSKGPITVVEHQEGMQFDRGFLHPWFVTNPERMECVLENTYVFVTDQSITTLAPFQKFFEEFLKKSKTLVIISPDISGEALPMMIQNKLKGFLQANCIQAPSMGLDQKNILQDIAVLTGATLFSSDAGYKLEDLKVEHLGFAENITSTKDETIIVGGKGTKEAVDAQIATIQKFIDDDTQKDWDHERLRARMGRLTNGVSVIRVGGQTEIERDERRERVIDAVAATRAAMEQGIVAGGETVYLRVRDILRKPRANISGNAGDFSLQIHESYNDSSLAERILYNALEAPFTKLVENAGLNAGRYMQRLEDSTIENAGVDVTDESEIKDMVKEGIIDPVAVSIQAIRNSVSVAIQLITTNVLITPIKEEA